MKSVSNIFDLNVNFSFVGVNLKIIFFNSNSSSLFAILIFFALHQIMSYGTFIKGNVCNNQNGEQEQLKCLSSFLFINQFYFAALYEVYSLKLLMIKTKFFLVKLQFSGKYINACVFVCLFTFLHLIVYCTQFTSKQYISKQLNVNKPCVNNIFVNKVNNE